MRQSRLVVDRHMVNMYGSTVNLLGDAQTCCQVLGENCGGETVLGVVCDFNGVGFVFVGEQDDGGAEGFGVVDVHFFGYAFDDDRAHSCLGVRGIIWLATIDRLGAGLEM